MKYTRIKGKLLVCGACGIVYSSPEENAFNKPCPECSSRDILYLTFGNGQMIPEWAYAYKRACAGILAKAKLKIWITLQGGLVQKVETTTPATVFGFDFDTENAGDEKLVKAPDGKDCHFYEFQTEVLTEEQQAEREDWLVNQF